MKMSKEELTAIKRHQPVPYNLTMQVDIWSGNTDQKLQLLEQILILFNPSIQLQQNTNPLDWTSVFEVELTDMQWSNRSVPAGVDETIDVSTLTFTLPIWLSPPAKVKRQKIINTIEKDAKKVVKVVEKDAKKVVEISSEAQRAEMKIQKPYPSSSSIYLGTKK